MTNPWKKTSANEPDPEQPSLESMPEIMRDADTTVMISPTESQTDTTAFAQAEGSMVMTTSAQPEGLTVTYKPAKPIAGKNKRAIAFIIDYAINFIVGVIVVTPFTLLFMTMSDGSDAGELVMHALNMLVSIVVSFGFALIYFTFFEALPCHATPGKLIMGLQVMARRGGRPTLFQIIKRNFVRTIFMTIIPFGTWLDCLFGHFRPSPHQAIHDLAGDTMVVAKDA